jgi:hypothetical protein
MSIQNYQSEMSASRATEDAQKLDAANHAAWMELLAMFPLADNTANYKLFVEYCNPLTIAGGTHLIQMKPQGFDFALTSREKLIEELGKLIRENTTTKTLSDHDFRSMVVRMSTWSLRQLRAKKKEIEFKHAHKTADSAREFLAGVRKVEPSRFPGWPQLPQRMVLPYGKIEYTEISAEYLKNLTRTDYYAFRRLCTIYGQAQITARLNNEA